MPENVKCLLRRCLTKDRHSRLRDIGDARLELEETLSGQARDRRDEDRTNAGATGRPSRRPACWGSRRSGCGRGFRRARLLLRRLFASPISLPPAQQMVPGWNPSVDVLA